MPEQIFIISMMVFAIWYTMQPGEIFAPLGNWLAAKLPEKLHSPVFDCPVCMVFWHGSVLYWILFMPVSSDGWVFTIYYADILDWITVVVSAMGLNAVLTRMWPKSEIKIKDEVRTRVD